MQIQYIYPYMNLLKKERHFPSIIQIYILISICCITIIIYFLIWRIYLMIIKGYKFVLCVEGTFNLCCLINCICLIKSEYDLFLYTENTKNERLNRFLSTKSPFECSEFTKVIVQSKSLYEMFVLKLFLVYKFNFSWE